MLTPWLTPLPLVAILRGLVPEESVAIGEALSGAGFRILEVPLNSPRPYDSIRRLVDALGDNYLVGAGTVMTPAQVDEVAAAGGRLIVMPHADTVVIRAAKAHGLVCVPGVATPTEAFAAIAAGADGLKLFPAEQASPKVLKAWRAVLPPELPVLPVGGIAPDTMAHIGAWLAAARLESGPLFRPLSKGGQVGAAALGGGEVARVFRDLATAAGLKLARLPSGHSTRVGATQDMFAAGFELLEVMQAGSWKTPAMPARYGERLRAQRGAARKLATLQNRA